MSMNFFRNIVIAICGLLFCCSCSTVENNYLQPSDFVAYLVQEGVPVEYIQPLDPAPLKASSAVNIRVAGGDLGIYKFDRSLLTYSRRQDDIAKAGAVYFLGAKYSATISGSFVLVDVEGNPEKDKILKAFKSFK